MIIMLAVIAALIALVYWKNVKNDVSVSAGQRPEEQEVTAKLLSLIHISEPTRP